MALPIRPFLVVYTVRHPGFAAGPAVAEALYDHFRHTRDIAVAFKFVPQPANFASWSGQDEFQQFDATALRNGLTSEENATLVRTVHVDEAVALILRGLLHLAKQPAGIS